MSGSRGLIAVNLDHDRVCAVGADVGTGELTVTGWLNSRLPQGMNARDSAVVGAWLGEELQRAGLGRGRLVFAVPRGEVILKKLKLPRGEGAGQSELAGMVRLQMTRQLTMAVEGTSIDYMPIGEEGTAEGVGVWVVLAAALPGERMLWYRDAAKAAGCKLERIGLRACGLAVMLAEIAQRQNGPVMAVAAGFGSVEFAIIEDGRLVFARAADVGIGSDVESDDAAAVSKIAVEAKRTWASYRVGEGASDVEAILVSGEGRLARELAKACGEGAELPWKLASLPGLVKFKTQLSELDALAAAPLIGLLAEVAVDKPTVDFAHPRKAPDLAAIKRQRVLLGVLGVIVLGGGAYVYSMMEIGSLRRRLEAAVTDGNALRSKYNAFLAEDARLGHIQQWTAARVDWIAHLKYLSDQMPDPRQALMDQVSGSLSAKVEFTTRDGRYDKKGWQVQQRAAFAVTGHIKQREVGDDLRKRLVSSDVYTTVESLGPDTPDQFALTLLTSRPIPEPAPRPPTKDTPKEASK